MGNGKCRSNGLFSSLFMQKRLGRVKTRVDESRLAAAHGFPQAFSKWPNAPSPP
jgi:hypothetical protein